MKLKITLILILASISLLKAQDNTKFNTSTDEVYKQVAGDKSFEVNFDPGKIFGSNPGNQFNLFDGGIKFRSFLTESSAIRVGVNISFFLATDIIQQSNTENNLKELKSKSSSFSLMIQPGYEKHFKGTKRLSPYIGVQGLIGFRTTKYIEENQKNSLVYTKTWNNDPNKLGYGNLDIGLGVFAGIDYYFIKKLYMGIEIGYGIQYSSLLNTKYTNEDNSDSDYDNNNGNVIGISPSLATGNIRLGWTF